jgi:hypothetical protein
MIVNREVYELNKKIFIILFIIINIFVSICKSIPDDNQNSGLYLFPIRTLGWYHINEAGTAVCIKGSLALLFSMGLYDVGFVLDTKSHFSYKDYSNRISAHDYDILNSFSSNIYNLQRTSTYFYRAIGKHKSTGITYQGLERSFKLGLLIIYTNHATNIRSNSAILNGEVSYMGGAPNCYVWFEYGMNENNLIYETTHRQISSKGTFSEPIYNLLTGFKYYFRAVGSNDCGIRYGATYNFTVSGGSENNPPLKPDKPSGETNTVTNITYYYSTLTLDPENDDIRYGWDWDGDDNIDEWTDFFASGEKINISHIWKTAGTFLVKVIAEDDYGAQSIYSDSLEVVTNDNRPPNNPNSDYNKFKDELVVRTSDPDGHQIRYGVSWDNDYTVDYWTDFVDSNIDQRIDCEGRKVTVGIIAEDEYGAQSSWISQESKFIDIQKIFTQILESHTYLCHSFNNFILLSK